MVPDTDPLGHAKVTLVPVELHAIGPADCSRLPERHPLSTGVGALTFPDGLITRVGSGPGRAAWTRMGTEVGASS